MVKKIVSTILLLSMSFSFFSTTAFASTIHNEISNQQIVFAKSAFIYGVIADGSNFNNNTIDDGTNEGKDSKLEINVNPDNSLTVLANINDEDISITGVPIGRSENSNVIFLNGESNDSKYSVMNFSIEKNIAESSMYFNDYKQKDNSKLSYALKLYLKTSNSNSRDYIILEAFNLKPIYDDQFISKLSPDNLLGNWAVREFEPIDSYFGPDYSMNGMIQPMATSYNENYLVTKTWDYMGETITQTIGWSTNADLSNIPIGQQSSEYYRLTITKKSCIYSKSTQYNSNTSSSLHVNGLRLVQTSIPYTAWKSTEIDGIVQNNGSSGSLLSAKVGVKLGLLSVALDLATLFSSGGTVDINTAYTSYVNGVNNEYTRSIETNMNSNFKLTQIGHYFQVKSELRDYGNAKRTAQQLKARWYVDIINLENWGQEIYYYYCDDNHMISIN